jgi:hypothetical protein
MTNRSSDYNMPIAERDRDEGDSNLESCGRTGENSVRESQPVDPRL